MGPSATATRPAASSTSCARLSGGGRRVSEGARRGRGAADEGRETRRRRVVGGGHPRARANGSRARVREGTRRSLGTPFRRSRAYPEGSVARHLSLEPHVVLQRVRHRARLLHLEDEIVLVRDHVSHAAHHHVLSRAQGGATPHRVTLSARLARHRRDAHPPRESVPGARASETRTRMERAGAVAVVGPTGWAHTRVVRPMSDRPSKNAESTWKITPPRRGDHRPRPPRSARRSRAGRLYVSITHKGKSHVARAPAARARLSQPPALFSRFSLFSWPTVSAPRDSVGKAVAPRLHARAPARHHPPVMRARVRFSSAPVVVHVRRRRLRVVGEDLGEDVGPATPERPPTSHPEVNLAQPSEDCTGSRVISRPERVLTPMTSSVWNAVAP